MACNVAIFGALWLGSLVNSHLLAALAALIAAAGVGYTWRRSLGRGGRGTPPAVSETGAVRSRGLHASSPPSRHDREADTFRTPPAVRRLLPKYGIVGRGRELE